MSKFNFQRVKNNIAQVKRELPILLASDAQNYFLGAFKDEGWNGAKWAEVQRREPDTKAYKYAKPKSNRTKKILVNTGRLRREVSLLAGNAQITYNMFNFTVKLAINDGTVPYAGYNNDGTENTPQRKFMGDSPALRDILRKRIEKFMSNVWKG